MQGNRFTRKELYFLALDSGSLSLSSQTLLRTWADLLGLFHQPFLPPTPPTASRHQTASEKLASALL